MLHEKKQFCADLLCKYLKCNSYIKESEYLSILDTVM
jgi:hypothetical protein